MGSASAFIVFSVAVSLIMPSVLRELREQRSQSQSTTTSHGMTLGEHGYQPSPTRHRYPVWLAMLILVGALVLVRGTSGRRSPYFGGRSPVRWVTTLLLISMLLCSVSVTNETINIRGLSGTMRIRRSDIDSAEVVCNQGDVSFWL